MQSPFVCNSCWMIWCRREARRYERDTHRAEDSQTRLLREIVSRNATTWFGTRHGFSRIGNVEEFRRQVPLTTYDDYREPIERIAAGEVGVLTAEPVQLFQPTSGTTSAEKLIPYTAGLRREFQRAIRVWIHNLFSQRPAVRHGYAYWSISPMAYERRSTPGGIPIGFDDDSSYLGHFERLLLSRTMAVPPAIAGCASLHAAGYATLFFLLRCPRLSLISVWSPTFLSGLFHLLGCHHEQLCEDVERGRISADVPASLARPFPPNPARADRLRAILLEGGRGANGAREIWPTLAVVSCWTDGPSATYAKRLQDELGGIEIEPKGLLSTEAFVSFPLLPHAGAALAVRSHFFEFQPVDEMGEVVAGEPLLAHVVQPGQRYRVVVTTSGGLYRYQTMDQVEVVGFHNQVPLVRFVGKGDRTSDLVGEKLNAAFVQTVLESAINSLGLSPHGVDLAAQDGAPPCYRLRLIDSRLAKDMSLADRLRAEVEGGLRKNPHYAYAVDAGQLNPLRLEVSGLGYAGQGSPNTGFGDGIQLHHGNLKPSPLAAPSH